MSKADAAAMKGVTRGAVSHAIRSGALRSAVLPGGRLDASHPDFARWLGRPLPPPIPQTMVLEETAPTVAELAEQTGIDTAELDAALADELADALIPPGHVSLSEFAARVELPLARIERAARRELAPSVTPTGRIDLAHPTAIEFLAAHPFVGRMPTIAGEGFLRPALLPSGDIDAEHPVALAFLARSTGEVPA